MKKSLVLCMFVILIAFTAVGCKDAGIAPPLSNAEAEEMFLSAYLTTALAASGAYAEVDVVSVGDTYTLTYNNFTYDGITINGSLTYRINGTEYSYIGNFTITSGGETYTMTWNFSVTGTSFTLEYTINGFTYDFSS